MGTFLNRLKIVEQIQLLITRAHEEVIMITPYLKISSDLYDCFRKAEEKGIQFLILYREDKVNGLEKEKLKAFTNVTLFYHPDVHSKCYANEYNMVVCSMNLYEYSARNNREMGILLERGNYEDDEIIEDALREIKSLIKASKLEVKSAAKKTGSDFKIIELKEDLLQRYLNSINAIFGHKQFEIVKDYNFPKIVCDPYYENVAVNIDYDIASLPEADNAVGEISPRRIAINLLHSKDQIIKIHELFWSNFSGQKFDQFKVYWNNPENQLTIYAERKRYPQWNELTFEQSVKKFKQGLDMMIDYLKPIIKSVKK